jgi:CRISPR/Cas system-associated exonuclease Cas4 (RecB family)
MAIYDRLLSPSSINLYLSCPYEFYLKYIKDIKFESGDAALFGSSVHKVNEKFWPEYKKNSDILTAMKASVDTYWDPKVNEEYVGAARTCLDNFMAIVGENPAMVPLYTELRCENTVNNTVAIIDVVYPHKIVDYKTSTQYTKSPKQPNIIQAVMCSQNLKECFGLDVKHIEFQYLRFKKYQVVDATSELVEEVNQIIEQVREGIVSDKFPKNEKSCFFCQYSLICRAEKKLSDKQSKSTRKKYAQSRGYSSI